LAWIAFRVKDTNDMLYSMQKYILLDFQITTTIEFISSHKIIIIFMILFGILHLISYKKKNLPEIISNFRLMYWIIFLSTIMTMVLLFYNGRPEDFIYFEF
jgi:hypothetical protein